MVNRTDSRRIAKFMKMSLSSFENQYLTQDDDGDQVMKLSPCPFLQPDHYCSIYEVRPKACRDYPHTDGQQFTKNLRLHVQNSHYCPAVFHILENLKKAF